MCCVFVSVAMAVAGSKLRFWLISWGVPPFQLSIYDQIMSKRLYKTPNK